MLGDILTGGLLVVVHRVYFYVFQHNARHNPTTYDLLYNPTKYDLLCNPARYDLCNPTKYNLIYNPTKYDLLCRAGLDTEVHAMETTRFLDQEDNYVVWDTADRALDYPSIILSRYTSTYTEFQVSESLTRYMLDIC